MSKNTKNQFATTRDMFVSCTNYTKPLSYEEWLATDHDYKAAVLYCQFYNEITLAWYKLASVYSSESDGVAEVIQYLLKNVDKIIEDGKRFSAAYIYKIVYNCLYCLCRDPNKYKQAYENETSNIAVGAEDTEYDLFDTVVDHDGEDEYDSVRKDRARQEIWNLIEKKGSRDYIIVVAELLGDNEDWTGRYVAPDYRDPNGPSPKDFKIYKKSEDVSEARLAGREADLRERYGADLVSSFEEIYKVDKKGKGYFTIKYSVREEREYRGTGKFSARDIASVSADRRAEIIADLASTLAKFKDLFI